MKTLLLSGVNLVLPACLLPADALSTAIVSMPFPASALPQGHVDGVKGRPGGKTRPHAVRHSPANTGFSTGEGPLRGR